MRVCNEKTCPEVIQAKEDAYNLGYESGRKQMFLLLNDETNKNLKFIDGLKEKYLGEK